MKLGEMKSILYSVHGYPQRAIIFSLKSNRDLEEGIVDYLVNKYKDENVRRIEAFENQILITLDE